MTILLIVLEAMLIHFNQNIVLRKNSPLGGMVCRAALYDFHTVSYPRAPW